MKKNRLLDYPAMTGWHKLFLVMKLTTFLVLALILNATAAGYSQNSKVSVNVKNGTLSEIFSQIEAQSNYRFFYQNEQILNVDRKSVDVNDKNVEELVKSLLYDTGLSYKFVDRNIIIYPKSEEATFAQQQIPVSGKVTDTNNAPLPGVTVVIKGTTNGTVTDVDGKYSFSNIPSDAVLVFSFVGMRSKEVDVANQTTINVSLEEETVGIGEVVAIGYGTQRKEAVTGSVASVRGNELREVPSSDITQALQGRVSGVEMSQTSSKPGAQLQIRIRGTRSLTASNDPLVVLDGVPFAGSISDINPNDIKSIDILKDASATAIYGSRGANGVILVTTNKGQKGQKAKISYNGYYGLKNAIKYPMMNGPELVALREAAGQYTNGEDESNDINTDWQDLFYRTGKVTSHDISVSGGTKTGNYNFGGGYYLDQAVIPTSQYSRFSLRGSIDQNVGKYVKVGFTTNNNYNVTEGSQVGLYSILSMSPIASPYNEDGSLKRTIKMPLDETWLSTKEVVNQNKDRWLSETKAYGSYNTIYGEMKIPGVDGLKYRANIGLNFRMKNGGSFTGEGINSSNAANVSTASIDNTMTTNWVIENLLTYDKTFADKHRVNAVALYSTEESKYNRSHVSAKDIPNEDFQYYNLGQAAGEITVNPDDQDYWKTGLTSWMGRVMYSYNDRYMITATVRSDASSRLAKGHQWHTYPAVSAGWNIKQESFMQDVTPINRLKLRVGYGQTSNQAVKPYATLGRLSTRPYNFGNDNYSTGYYVSQLPNPNLGWEYSETWNYGVDFGLFNNRLSGTIEYYSTNTKDILLNVNLPNTSGVSSYTGNIGETSNKGLELSLNGTILDDANGWTWDAGVNLYGNRNELIALASGTTEDKSNWWFVGHPINVVYDYQKVGLWQEGDPNLDILEPGGNVGMIKVKYAGDYNTDGTPTRAIGPDDRQIMSLEPKFQGGFNTRVAYKGFDLSIVGSFKSGGMLISTLYSSAGYLNMMSGRRNNVKVDYWTPDNTGAKYPKPGGVTSGDNPKYGSTLGYFKASYLKIRTATLGYNFDNQQWLKDAGISRLRLYITAQNPLVMFSPYHKESGMDPETNSYANENTAVPYSDNLKRLLTISANTPSTHNYLIGINLTF